MVVVGSGIKRNVPFDNSSNFAVSVLKLAPQGGRGCKGLLGKKAILRQLKYALEFSSLLEAPLALVCWDIDGLNRVNRVYGRATGDRLIDWVSAHLESTLRRTDIAGRINGDSFLLVLPDTDERTAYRLVDRVQDTVHDDAFLAESGARIPVSLSCAIAIAPEDGEDAQTLLDVIDERLAEAGEMGGGAIVSRTDFNEQRTQGQYGGVLDLLCTALAKKDVYTSRHSESVSLLALRIGRALGFKGEALRNLAVAGLVHDIGKMNISDRLLRKPGRLTDSEYALVKQHVAFGDAVLRDIPSLHDTLNAVLYHHERYDGEGYPAGVAGEDIPIEGRILAVADAYSAMTLDRPYHKGLSPREAVAEMRRCPGTQFDPAIVDVFLAQVA